MQATLRRYGHSFIKDPITMAYYILNVAPYQK